MSADGAAASSKWLVVLAIAAPLALLFVDRCACTGDAPTVPMMVACNGCGFRGQAELPVAFSDWPARCPTCGKPSAYPAVPCPKCGRLLANDPKTPPTKCPFCNSPLKEDALAGP